MPKINESVQHNIWRIGDALYKALRVGSENFPADESWRVEQVSNLVWKIDHPELPVVNTEEGLQRDILLQLTLKQNEDTGQWLVIAQNRVTGVENLTSEVALIVAKEDSPPDDTWDYDTIGMAAANYFKKQKNEMDKLVQALTPNLTTEPQPQQQPGRPGGLGMPGRMRANKRCSDRIVIIRDNQMDHLKKAAKELKGAQQKAVEDVLDKDNALAETYGKIRTKPGSTLANRRAIANRIADAMEEAELDSDEEETIEAFNDQEFDKKLYYFE